MMKLDIEFFEGKSEEIPVEFEEKLQKLPMGFDEVVVVGGGTDFKTDDTLTLKDGVLSVNVATAVEKNNELPVSSNAVANWAQVKNLVVKINISTMTATHSSEEIYEHLNLGGNVYCEYSATLLNYFEGSSSAVVFYTSVVQTNKVLSLVVIIDKNKKVTAQEQIYNPPKELPEVTAKDKGKVATVDENGKWSVAELEQPEIPDITIDKVDASKVVFPETVYTSYAVGNIQLENGLGVMAYEGESLLERDKRVWLKEMIPEIKQPSVSITFSQAKSYEAGTYVTPSYTATFSEGSYQYGNANGTTTTGVTASSWSVKDTNNVTKTTSSGSFAQIQATDGISYKITATANHTAGLVPVTNTKNEYPSGQIKAGSKSATSGAVTAYRNTFYGTLTEKSTITSAVIRNLVGKSGKSLSNGSTFTVPVPVGALRVVIAYPDTLREITSIKDVNGMNAEIKSSFVKSVLAVQGTNSYLAINYKIYILDFANANDKENKFTVQI